MKRLALGVGAVMLVILACGVGVRGAKVEIVRDKWGTPHVYAARTADAFFGLGYATAEDRLIQMELFRRRSTGRLAEVFGAKWVDSDRKFRVAGISQYCAAAVKNLPEDLRGYLRSYAAGVNAYVGANRESAEARIGLSLGGERGGDST